MKHHARAGKATRMQIESDVKRFVGRLQELREKEFGTKLSEAEMQEVNYLSLYIGAAKNGAITEVHRVGPKA